MAKKRPSENQLRAKYPTGLAVDSVPTDKTLWLPSRILPLNYALGGGIPYGRIVEVFGWESSGKSLLAYDFAYCAQQLGGMVLWADAEGSYMNSWADRQGVDASRVEVLNSSTVEIIGDWSKDMILHYREQLVNNEPILLVIDSLAASDVLANEDAELSGGKAEMGNRAKAWDKFFRLRRSLFDRLGVIVLVVNQVRNKLGAGMFESNETTPGGKATAFYASQRISIIKRKQIRGSLKKDGFVEEQKGKKVGNNVSFSIVKNKVAPPSDTVKTQVYFQDIATGYTGYNRYMGLADLALDQEVIKKTGNTYSIGKHKIGIGIGQVEEAIVSNKKMRSAIIKRLGINTITRTAEKLEATTENLFPLEA